MCELHFDMYVPVYLCVDPYTVCAEVLPFISYKYEFFAHLHPYIQALGSNSNAIGLLLELLPVCVLHIPLSVKCEHQSDPWYAVVFVCACMRPPDVRDTRELPKHLGGTQAVNVDKLRDDECPDVCGKFWACLADCCWKNWTIVRHVKTNARFSARAPMRVPCRACVASGWSGPA